MCGGGLGAGGAPEGMLPYTGMLYARASCWVVSLPDAPDLSTRRRHTPGEIIAVQLPKLEMPADIMGYFLWQS